MAASMSLPLISTKLSSCIKGDPASGGCLQRRFQRPGVAYFFLCIFLLLVSLHSLAPYMPKRRFSDTTRPDKCDNCFPYTYKNIIEPKALCKPKDVVELVLLITTIPRERIARDIIRATWCNRTAWGEPTFRCVFLFGHGYSKSAQTSLESEGKIHNDILQEDFPESYYNLSIKVLMGYRWLMRACTQAKHVIRTAEDNYVNVPQVLELLRAKGNKLENFMFGHCRAHAVVWRWPFHKWVVSFKEYPNMMYPPYCVGTTFVTSFKLMTEIVKISVNVPFFPLEDVYFGMCMQQYNNRYRLAAVEGFSTPLVSWSEMFSVGESSPCSFPKPWYSIHDVSPTDMRRIWSECRRTEVERVPDLSAKPEEDLRLNNIYFVDF